MKPEEISHQKEKNLILDQNFIKNRQGQDEPSPNFDKGEMWLKVIYKTGKYAPTESELFFRDYIINEHSFYYYDFDVLRKFNKRKLTEE